MDFLIAREDQQIRQKEKADRERAETISRAVQDYVDKNPGMSHATAWNLLRQKRPELFTDEQGRDPFESSKLTGANQKKQQAIRDAIKKMQDADKDLTFTVAWRQLMKQKPQLFDFEEPKRRMEPEEPETATAANPGVETS